jgi:hypothetical protein
MTVKMKQPYCCEVTGGDKLFILKQALSFNKLSPLLSSDPFFSFFHGDPPTTVIVFLGDVVLPASLSIVCGGGESGRTATVDIL